MAGDVSPAPLPSLQWAVVNDVYSSPVFLLVVAAALAGWTVLVGLPAWNAGRRVQAALRDMRAHLIGAGDADEVARSYKDLDDRFRADELLGDAWSRLDRTLLRPGPDGKWYRQTVPAREAFNLELLQSAGVNLRPFRAHANTLVGVGLVLTFVGLVIALKAAGGTLAANDPGEVQRGLQALLNAAGSKFAFSVLGLVLSLMSAGWLRRLLGGIDAALASCIEALDKRLPPLTAVEVAVRTQVVLQSAASAQREGVKAAADALARRFDAALSQRLAEVTAPLAEAITRMTGSIGDSNRRALQEMADHFAARLEAVAAEDIRQATLAMERVGAHVTALAETLDGTRDRFGRAGEVAVKDITTAASDAARRIAEAAEVAHAALAAAGPDWVRASEGAAAQLRARLADAAGDFAASIQRNGEKFEEGGRKIAERLARAASDAGREIRSAGTALSAASETAGGTLTAAAKEASAEMAGAANAIAVMGARTGAAFEVADGSVREVASAMEEVRRTVAAASDLIERAAKELGSAGQRLGSVPAAALVLDELRSSAGRLAVIAEAMAPAGAVGHPIHAAGLVDAYSTREVPGG
ncbi:hypothetical protein [Belnapia rosea]|uniref:hypothetical protein n=1 Tax=Belnapia rosea TaxID=938405 RepID=UPI000886AF60|nr:hypothetical protein [Belnapia rosea]SDB20523.1 hypothetical protein SAMN02927895_00808 [Belnapia rosea]